MLPRWAHSKRSRCKTCGVMLAKTIFTGYSNEQILYVVLAIAQLSSFMYKFTKLAIADNNTCAALVAGFFMPKINREFLCQQADRQYSTPLRKCSRR